MRNNPEPGPNQPDRDPAKELFDELGLKPPLNLEGGPPVNDWDVQYFFENRILSKEDRIRVAGYVNTYRAWYEALCQIGSTLARKYNSESN